MISPHYTALDIAACNGDGAEALRHGVRPAILRNSHTGREALWVSEFQTARLHGMDRTDSRATLHAVFAVLYRPSGVVEYKWRRGDVIFWDNIAIQHARRNLGSVGRRVLQRVIVGTQGAAPHVRA